MEWQDAVFGIGSIIFLAALIPSVVQKKCPSLWTSIPTALVLIAFTVAYESVEYHFAATVSVLTAMVWLVLASQCAFSTKT